MKKTTLLRKTAYLVSPQIADGFVPPANFDYKISVSLHEVDIKIYGFTGTSWELMHDSDGVIASFETEVQHQKYYFESKSGQEQTVRVSFLSTEDAPGAGIRTGVTSETRRFYDIEEIPVYNGSRDGAMLTVMSDGSLAWLLVNESFTVPEEGGNAIAGTFLEDMPAVIARAPSAFSSGIYTDNGQGGGQGISVFLNDDDILEYDSITNETVNDEFTISWWMNLNSSQTANNLGLAGMNMGQVNGVVRRFVFDLGGGSTLVNPHFMSYTRGPRTTMNLNTGVSMAGVWTHVAIVIKNDSSNTVASLYLNGNKLPNSISEPLGTKFFPPSSHQVFKFGAGFQSNSVKGQFDSMQIADGTALTDSQVAAIAGQADRQMSIETAAQAGGAQPLSFTELFLEESQSFYDTNNPKSQVSIQDFEGDGNIYVRTEQTYSSATIPVSEVMTFDGDHPEASKFTMSLWFKTAGTNRSDFRIAGFKTSTSGFGMRITNSSTRLELINFIDTHPKITLPSTMDNSWHHVCMTYEAFELDGVTPLSAGGFASGDSIYHKMTCYYDGSSNSVVVEGASTGRLFKEDVTGDFHLGALPGINGNGQTGRRFFDSVEMIEGLALTGAQVDSIYSDTTRQTSAADVS